MTIDSIDQPFDVDVDTGLFSCDKIVFRQGEWALIDCEKFELPESENAAISLVHISPNHPEGKRAIYLPPYRVLSLGMCYVPSCRTPIPDEILALWKLRNHQCLPKYMDDIKNGRY